MYIKEKPSFNDFFNVTKNVYGDNSSYVSLFKDDLKRFLSLKNPLFNKYGRGTYFVAFKDNIPVGRISAHIHDKSNEVHNEKVGYFGYFESINDLDVAKALLNHAEEWLREKGINKIKGNFNLTAMQQIGVMTSGFENYHYTDQVYGSKHLPLMLEENGYSKIFPMSTFELELSGFDETQLLKEKVQSVLNNNDYEFVTLKKKKIKAQMDLVRHVLNDGFQDNPMFVSLTNEEFEFQAKDMMWIIDEKISSLVTYKGKPVGTVVCIPDLNDFLKSTKSQFSLGTIFKFIRHKFKRDKAVIIFYSVTKDFHGQGINPAMLYQVITVLKLRGYKKLGFTWIADVNKSSLRQMEKLGAKKLHGLHLYEKVLS